MQLPNNIRELHKLVYLLLEEVASLKARVEQLEKENAKLKIENPNNL